MDDNVVNIHFDVKGSDFAMAGEASSAVKMMLKKIGVQAEDIRRTAIAMYEAEMNMVIHAGGGEIDVKIDSTSIKMVFTDKGPGIENLELAMQEGYSTAPDEVREKGFGAGMGLPNIKRYSDELNIVSEVGKGTTVEITVVFRK
jgi:anti-sigma regulatory factor (Ser/Thr protein kinase)